MCPDCDLKDFPLYDSENDFFWCPCGWKDSTEPITFRCNWCGEIELEEHSQFIFHHDKWIKICRKCSQCSQEEKNE